MIELKEFVTSVICQIMDGVADAQAQSQGVDHSDSLIAPTFVQMRERLGSNTAQADKHKVGLRMVEFDVAVSASERGTTEGRAGVFVAGLGGGVKGGVESEQGHVNRIRFAIPIILPTSERDVSQTREREAVL